MASKGNKPDDSRFVGGLAERGEKAVNRVMEELARNPRVTDALDKAMSAKGKVDSSARRTLSQLGLAAADELKDLRMQIERLERRLARVEDTTGTKTASSAKRSETKKTPTAKKSTTTEKAAPKKKKPSPPAGRSLGGGTGRGSSAGSGSSTS
jgi:polyhydroxyalkanoate synthesis regulator phasin